MVEAKKITDPLLSQHLIACVNFHTIVSEYHWKNEIAQTEEVVALLKTTIENFEEVAEYVENNHPYDTPCIIKLAEVEANEAYADWLQSEVK